MQATTTKKTRTKRPKPAVTAHFGDSETILQVLGVGNTFLYDVLLPMGLPSIVIGRRRFFDIADCIQWMKTHDAAEREGGAK